MHIQHIEARDGSARQNDGRWPDDEQDPDPKRRVDYVCTVGTPIHAFEHTGIEPFSDQIKCRWTTRSYLRRSSQVINKFRLRSIGSFTSLLMLQLASAAEKIKKVQDALIDWINANAATLPVKRFGDTLPYATDREFNSSTCRFASLCTVTPCRKEQSNGPEQFWRREFI